MTPFVFVIDDFLDDPDAVRRRALQLDYQVEGRFPGRNSTEKIIIPGLEQIVSQLVHASLCAPWDESFSHCNVRLSLASDDRPGRIHIDQSHWSGILYLTRNEDCQGGTEFFRHLPTGTDRVPMTPDQLRSTGYDSYEALQKEILDRDALDRSKWERTMTVPMRYNRLILLQPQYWHTSGPSFGDSIENGRLVYLLFFMLQRQRAA